MEQQTSFPRVADLPTKSGGVVTSFMLQACGLITLETFQPETSSIRRLGLDGLVPSHFCILSFCTILWTYEILAKSKTLVDSFRVTNMEASLSRRYQSPCIANFHIGCSLIMEIPASEIDELEG